MVDDSSNQLPPAVVVQPRYTRSNTWLTLTIIEGKANQDGRENSIESKLKLVMVYSKSDTPERLRGTMKIMHPVPSTKKLKLRTAQFSPLMPKRGSLHYFNLLHHRHHKLLRYANLSFPLRYFFIPVILLMISLILFCSP